MQRLCGLEISPSVIGLDEPVPFNSITYNMWVSLTFTQVQTNPYRTRIKAV